MCLVANVTVRKQVSPETLVNLTCLLLHSNIFWSVIRAYFQLIRVENRIKHTSSITMSTRYLWYVDLRPVGCLTENSEAPGYFPEQLLGLTSHLD